MDDYILFCDETKKSPTNDYFLFCGFATTRTYYVETIIPEINNLKKSHFGTTDIVFHYTEMKNNKGAFSCMKDPDMRSNFYKDFKCCIRGFDITTFGIYYKQDIMQNIYKNKSFGHYNIGFINLLENYLHFLCEVDGYGSFTIESRTFKENSILQRSFTDYLANGSVYYSPDIAAKHLASLSFTIKEENCVGLQIADFIPASFSRIVNAQVDKQSLGSAFKTKLYKAKTEYESILGLSSII